MAIKREHAVGAPLPPAHGVRIVRECGLLRKLQGMPNLLQLQRVLLPLTRAGAPDAYFSHVYIVTEALDSDLKKVLDRDDVTLTADHVKWFSFKLLKSVALLHELGISHRDIKPQNVFLSAACDLKLGDFGLARSSEGVSASGTVHVVTRQCVGLPSSP